MKLHFLSDSSLLWLFKVSAFLKLANGQKDTFASIMKLLMTKLWKIWMRFDEQPNMSKLPKWFKVFSYSTIQFYYIFAIFCKFWIVNEIVNYIDKLAISSTITFHESLTFVENLKRVNVWEKFVSFLWKNT